MAGQSMTLTQINKTVYQGVDDELPFVITDVNGAFRNINAATFNWAAYHNITGDVLQKTLGDGLALGNPTRGEIAVLFTAAEMTIPPLTYTYQLEMTLTISGITTTTIEATGYLIVQPNRILTEVAP
jgi:hypothetical protein